MGEKTERIGALELTETFKKVVLYQMEKAKKEGAEPEMLNAFKNCIDFMMDYPKLFFHDVITDEEAQQG